MVRRANRNAGGRRGSPWKGKCGEKVAPWRGVLGKASNQNVIVGRETTIEW